MRRWEESQQDPYWAHQLNNMLVKYLPDINIFNFFKMCFVFIVSGYWLYTVFLHYIFAYNYFSNIFFLRKIHELTTLIKIKFMSYVWKTHTNDQLHVCAINDHHASNSKIFICAIFGLSAWNTSFLPIFVLRYNFVYSKP